MSDFSLLLLVGADLNQGFVFTAFVVWLMAKKADYPESSGPLVF